jgi:DNA-binding beta-propeller fold protein YncE
VPNGISGAEVGITPDGRFVYVLSQLSDAVFGYQIRPDGSLTAVPGSPFPSGDNSEGVAISADGRRIYIAAVGPSRASPGEITGWAIRPDGSLTEIERVPTSDDPVSIVFALNGRRLYVADFLDDEVTVFRLSRRGKLKDIQTLDSLGPDPGRQSIAILPNRGPVAGFSVRSGPAGSQIRFDATASADPDGTVARYDWDFGDGTVRRDGGRTPHHVYRAPGTYEAQLTVIDDEGCSARLVFTGQMASCVGTAAATTTRTVVIN